MPLKTWAQVNANPMIFESESDLQDSHDQTETCPSCLSGLLLGLESSNRYPASKGHSIGGSIGHRHQLPPQSVRRASRNRRQVLTCSAGPLMRKVSSTRSSMGRNWVRTPISKCRHRDRAIACNGHYPHKRPTARGSLIGWNQMSERTNHRRLYQPAISRSKDGLTG